MIFNFGDYDDGHAGDIADTLLQQANDRSIPIKTDAGITDEQLREGLREEFVAFIRQWRTRIIEMLT